MKFNLNVSLDSDMTFKFKKIEMIYRKLINSPQDN